MRVALLPTLACATIDLKRVHLVDQIGSNLLFRGNMPTNKTDFAIDDLKSFMQQRATESGVQFPSDYRLVDITLNNVFDYDHHELDFWKKAPASFGELVKWPMGFDGIVSPHDLNDAARKKICTSGIVAVDDLVNKTANLFQWMSTPAAKPTVYYVHCSAGCDRTGEFVAAYRIFHGDFHAGRPEPTTVRNISEIYAEDVAECGRPPNYFSTTALKWLCFCHSYTGMTFSAGAQVSAPICEHFASCKTFGDCTPVGEDAVVV